MPTARRSSRTCGRGVREPARACCGFAPMAPPSAARFGYSRQQRQPGGPQLELEPGTAVTSPKDPPSNSSCRGRSIFLVCTTISLLTIIQTTKWMLRRYSGERRTESGAIAEHSPLVAKDLPIPDDNRHRIGNSVVRSCRALILTPMRGRACQSVPLEAHRPSGTSSHFRLLPALTARNGSRMVRPSTV